MNRAIFGALVTLALMGTLAVPPASAQEVYPAEGAEVVSGVLIDAGDGEGYPVLGDSPVFETGDGGSFIADETAFGPSDVGPCCGVCGGGNCTPSPWYFQAGARILAASKVRRHVLAQEFIGIQAIAGSNDTIDVFRPRLGTKSVDFDVAAGYAFTLGRYLGRDSENRDQFIEFGYWGMNHWEVSRQVTAERMTRLYDLDPDDGLIVLTPITFGRLFSPFDNDIGGFNRADTHGVFYELEVHNMEANLRFVPRGGKDRLVLHPSGSWRRECTPGEHFSFLVGLRAMRLREGYIWTANGLIEVEGQVPAPTSGEYHILAHNDLFGLQIGGEYTVRQCKWHYGARIKAGPYFNFADQRSRAFANTAGDPLATTPLDFVPSKRRDDAALIGEFGFFTRYKLRPNLQVHASYDFMWVTGLARGPEQLLFQADPPVELNTNGHTYFHGLTMGLEWTW